MRWSVRSVGLLAGLVLCSWGASAQDDGRLELKLRGWFTDLSGDTSYLREFNGNKLSLDDALGVSGDNLPELQVRWQINEKHALKLAYAQMSYDGDEWNWKPILVDNDNNWRKATRWFNKGRQNYGMGNRVETDLDLKYFRFGWRYGLFVSENDTFKLETILDAAVFDVDASYDLHRWFNPFWSAAKDDVSFTGALPMVGLAATYRPVERLSFFAELSGMTAGSYGHMFDTELGVKFDIAKQFSVEAGYRYFKIKGEDDDDTAKVSIDGPFIGASIRF